MSLHYENNGGYWKWYSDMEGLKYFCTDRNGEGIFLVDLLRNERTQLEGTLDFSLIGIKNPQAKIRRWMKS